MSYLKPDIGRLTLPGGREVRTCARIEIWTDRRKDGISSLYLTNHRPLLSPLPNKGITTTVIGKIEKYMGKEKMTDKWGGRADSRLRIQQT